MVKIYLGCGASREIFKSGTTPTFAKYGKVYSYVIGPFKTMRGARFMRDYGKGNPHCQTVNDAERLARG